MSTNGREAKMRLGSYERTYLERAKRTVLEPASKEQERICLSLVSKGLLRPAIDDEGQAVGYEITDAGEAT